MHGTEINKAEYLEDFKIAVEFCGGTEKLINLEFVLLKDEREKYRELLDVEKFKNFYVHSNTIFWENGATFAPCFLYELGVPVVMEREYA